MLVYHFEGVPRNPVTVALKNILTLGIYTKVWLYRINREMDGHEGFHIDLRWLGVMVALPIVTPIIVKFQTVRRLNKMVAHQVTVPILRSRYLGWASLVPVIGQALYAGWVQGTLNKHWFWHRREERIRLAKDRIKRIAAEPETEETLQRRFECEAEIRALEQEIQDETEAARIRLGPDRWNNRLAYAERMGSGGRMSRKELAAMRERDKKARKAEKAKRKAERGPLFGLLPKRDGAGADGDSRDPDNDADWEPTTPLPERSPDEIRYPAESEGRELTDEEQAELKAAEKLVAKRAKETERLAKQRDKLRKTREKQRLQAEKQEEKARAKKEKEEEKARLLAERKQAKAASKPDKGKKDKAKEKGGKKGKGKDKAKGKDKRRRKGTSDEAPPERIPVTPRRYKAPPQVHEAGDGPLRTLNITCPRCKSQIEGIQKRGDKPAKVTCPSCHLVGKV